MQPKTASAPFQLGTMYWENPNHEISRIEEDMRRIRDNNMSIIRKFIWWENVERNQGTFDFKVHDMVYEAAAKYDIGIMETFGVHPPHRLKAQLGARGIIAKDRYYCFDEPEVGEPLKRFIETVVSRYKDAPALKIWNVWNEPTKPPCHCEHTRRKFIEWLKAKYQTIEALQKAWLGEYQIFETVYPDSFEDLTVQWIDDAFRFGSRGRITPLDYDWHQFSVVNLTESVQWLADIIKAIDPNHETHANPNCPAGNGIMDGQDVYQQACVLDSVSVSVHPSHHFYNDRNLKNYPISQSFSADQIRSWGHALGKDAWIGELQAGTTFYHPEKYTPSADDIRHVLWQSVGRGLKGLLFWEWQAWRSSMMEVAEFSLRRAADGGPTERSIAAEEVGKILKDYQDVVRQARRPESKIALLYSTDSSYYKAIQKRSKPFLDDLEHEHTFALYGCYKALNRANFAVDFVNETQIGEGILKKYDVLYLPHVELITENVAEAIRKFVHNGGNLWADGRCAFLDEYVFLRDAIPGHGLDEVFGCREADFVSFPGSSEISLSDGRIIQGYRFAQYLEPTTGVAKAKFSSEQPAIIANRYGNGKTELVGSYLTLGLRNHDDEATMDYLAGFAKQAGVRPKVDIEPDTGLEACLLTGDTHDIIIATNHRGEATVANINLPNPCISVKCPMDGHAETVFQGNTITRSFTHLESAVFICCKA